ncbi:MAG: AlpA family phage regulatory protein [Acidobacteria bacterium]|nr:AlpA family phage regulatory protein [Acidobacteriota bacterium]
MSKILRLPEVIEITQRRRSTIYADIKAGRFPKPLPLGPRARGWLADDIEKWIRSCAESRQGAA